MKIRIDVLDTGKLRHLSGRAFDRVSERILKLAEPFLEREQYRHFQQQSGPDAIPWEPLSEATLMISQRQALSKVGGKAAGAYLRKTGKGGLMAVARKPAEGKQRTARVRRTRHSMVLVDTGRLRASVSARQGAGAVRRRRTGSLEIGTSLQYAKTHQLGTERVPQRKFLGLSKNARNRLFQLIDDIVRREFG